MGIVIVYTRVDQPTSVCGTGNMEGRPRCSIISFQHHLPYIRLLSNVGYGVSLGALILAVIIMLLCRWVILSLSLAPSPS